MEVTAVAEAFSESLLGKALIFYTVSQHAPTAESYLRKVIPATFAYINDMMFTDRIVVTHTLVVPALHSKAKLTL